LLLCFFVLLFAMSTIEKKKLIQASGSLKQAFGGLPAPYEVEHIPDQNTEEQISRPLQPERRVSYAKDELMREIEYKFRNKNLQETIEVTGTEQGITFRLSGDIAFEEGSSNLTPQALHALRFVADELIQFPSNPIEVEGHTNNTPSSREEGNWLLAADRAYSVMRYLIEYGSIWGQVNKKRFSYESFAEHDPIPNLSPELAKKMNRRVDIILMQTDTGRGTYFRDPTIKNPRTPLSSTVAESEETSNENTNSQSLAEPLLDRSP